MSPVADNLIIPDWPAPGKVQAFVTTRTGGFSQAPFDSFNLALHVNDDPVIVARNRNLLNPILPSEPVWLNQTHTNHVKLLTPGQRVEEDTDGSITFSDNVVCCVMTADCLPILLTDKAGSFVAAVHCGWRGLANGIINKCFEHIAEDKRQNVLAWLGPAIGPDAFEVGNDVRDSFLAISEDNLQGFKPHGNKWLCDIYQLARIQLSSLGVSDIYGGNWCTYSEQSKFFSYRRDGACGRMASCIYINS